MTMLEIRIFLMGSLLHLSEQHLSHPINYCNMASTCIHDSRMVCASSADGCTRRSFLDQCDMYEYNCDYGTRYQETYILFCATFPMSTPTKPSDETKLTLNDNANGINESMEITVTITTQAIDDLNTPLNTLYEKYSSSRFLSTKKYKNNTSTEFKAVEKDKNPKISLKVNRTTTEKSTMLNKISSVYSFTKPVANNVTGNDKEWWYNSRICCNRPKSWETTTETIVTVPIHSIPDQTSSSTKLVQTTTKLSPKFTFESTKRFVNNNISSPIHITSPMILSTSNLIKDSIILTVTQQPISTTPMSSNVSTCFDNCNHRPKTWETTLETLVNWPVHLMSEEIQTKRDTSTKTLKPDISEVLNILSTERDIINDSTKTQFINYSTKSYSNIKLIDYTKLDDRVELTKHKTKKHPFTICKTKCQRPHTWITSAKNYRRNYNAIN